MSKLRKDLTLNESILINYGSSLGAAIRNASDPQDPDHFSYAEMIPNRLESCFNHAVESNISTERAQELILAGVQSQISKLQFLNKLRAELEQENQ